jgi:hypothetical protein
MKAGMRKLAICDRRELLAEFAYFKDPSFAGPAPVDDDPGGEERDDAVRELAARPNRTPVRS